MCTYIYKEKDRRVCDALLSFPFFLSEKISVQQAKNSVPHIL